MATWELVDPLDLGRFLGRPVDSDRAETPLRVAAGWLRAATGLEDWSGLVTQGRLPDDLWAWVLELAGFALDNPTSLSERNDGEARRAWEPRRAEILSAAAERYGVGGALQRGPRFAFPAVVPWP